MMGVAFVGIEIFGIGMVIAALMLVLRGDGAREQKLMQCFLMGALIQNAGYLLELTAPALEAAVVAVKVQYIGSLTIPISYCYFIFSYCYEKTPNGVFRILKIADVFIIFLVFTCERHRLYYRNIEWIETVSGQGL